jgi:hypothetical protein
VKKQEQKSAPKDEKQEHGAAPKDTNSKPDFDWHCKFPCRQFAYDGQCKFGEGCKFVHAKDTSHKKSQGKRDEWISYKPEPRAPWVPPQRWKKEERTDKDSKNIKTVMMKASDLMKQMARLFEEFASVDS